MTAPGWYPDPSDPRRQRYFDGRTWTENYAPQFGAPTPGIGQPAKTGMSRGKKIGLGVGAAALALIALGSIGNSNKTTSSTSDSSGLTSTAVGTPTTATTAATTTTSTTSTTSTSVFTPAQDNAIAKAKSYLDFSGFSKQGLIKQLEFDKFTPAQAAYGAKKAYGG